MELNSASNLLHVSGEIFLRYGEILAIVLISAGYSVDNVPLDKAINEKMVYHIDCINTCNTSKINYTVLPI